MFKNLGQMMKQAQEMQEKMQAMQEEMERVEHMGVSGGGLVTVRVNGKNEVKKLDIDPSLIKPEEKEIMEDLIAAALNDAQKKVQAYIKEQTQQAMGGMNLPEGFKIPF